MRSIRFVNEKGVTLIELLAVIVLIVAIGAVSFSALADIFKDFNQGMLKSRLFKEAQKIEYIIADTVLNSTTIPDSTFYLLIDEKNPNRYSFYSAESGDIHYSFELDGNTLTYTEGEDSYVLSDNVALFSLQEEVTTRSLIYSIRLVGTVYDEQIEVILEDRTAYFPIWSR